MSGMTGWMDWVEGRLGLSLNGTPTLVNSTAAAGEGVNVYRRGNTVTLAIYLQAPAGGVGAGAAVATVAAEFRPPRYLRGMMLTTGNVVHPVSVHPAGNVITEGGLGANALLYGFLTYAV